MGKEQFQKKHWTVTCKRVELDHFLGPYITINWKLIKDLDVRPEAIKLLEKHSKIPDIGLGDFFFLIWQQKHRKRKTNVNKQMGLHQAKKLLHSKGNHQQNEKATYQKGEKYLQIIYLLRS